MYLIVWEKTEEKINWQSIKNKAKQVETKNKNKHMKSSVDVTTTFWMW